MRRINSMSLGKVVAMGAWSALNGVFRWIVTWITFFYNALLVVKITQCFVALSVSRVP